MRLLAKIALLNFVSNKSNGEQETGKLNNSISSKASSKMERFIIGNLYSLVGSSISKGVFTSSL